MAVMPIKTSRGTVIPSYQVVPGMWQGGVVTRVVLWVTVASWKLFLAYFCPFSWLFLGVWWSSGWTGRFCWGSSYYGCLVAGSGGHSEQRFHDISEVHRWSSHWDSQQPFQADLVLTSSCSWWSCRAGGGELIGSFGWIWLRFWSQFRQGFFEPWFLAIYCKAW